MIILKATGAKLDKLVTALEAGNVGVMDKQNNRYLEVLEYQIHYDANAKPTSAVVWLY